MEAPKALCAIEPDQLRTLPDDFRLALQLQQAAGRGVDEEQRGARLLQQVPNVLK